MIPEFRAWDKGSKMMIPVTCIDFGGHEIMKGYPCIVGYPDQGCYEFKNVELMQLTPFKDIHERKIYEDDLVKCTYTLNGSSAIGIVKMVDGCWSVDFRHLPPYERPFDPVYKVHRDGDYLKMFDRVLNNKREVVGNIHEGYFCVNKLNSLEYIDVDNYK